MKGAVACIVLITIVAMGLWSGCALPGSFAEASPAVVQMPGAGPIVVIEPASYNLNIEEALEGVRDQERATIISMALVEMRKKYPKLKLEDIEFKDFSHRIAGGVKAMHRGPTLGTVVVYFADRSSIRFVEGADGRVLRREQLYRVEFVLTDGFEAIYVQMSPPSPGIVSWSCKSGQYLSGP